MPIVDNYGWSSNRGPASCDFLGPPVIRTLERLKPRSVLDLGCGNGVLCRELVARGYSVTGVEPDSTGISIARENVPDAKFQQMSVDDDPGELLKNHPNGFDVVVSTEVIEHLYEPRRLPEFAAAVLRPGGRLVITTPYHGYLKNLAISLVNGWDGHADPLWDGGHIKLFSRKKMTQLLKDSQFQMEKFEGVGRVHWLWKCMLVVARKP